MKALFAIPFLLPAISLAADNDDSIIHWKTVAGVITAPNVDNPVAGIHSGTFPWVARHGKARVNVATGAVAFEVQGLVIDGANVSGTPGPVTEVVGTLVCDAGQRTQSIIDTPAVPLSARGDARFSGHVGYIPPCPNPLFLIRIGPGVQGAAGRWIATAAERFIGDEAD